MALPSSLWRCPQLRPLRSCQAFLPLHKQREAIPVTPGFREASLQHPFVKSGRVKTKLLYRTQKPACASQPSNPCYQDYSGPHRSASIHTQASSSNSFHAATRVGSTDIGLIQSLPSLQSTHWRLPIALQRNSKLFGAAFKAFPSPSSL